MFTIFYKNALWISSTSLCLDTNNNSFVITLNRYCYCLILILVFLCCWAMNNNDTKIYCLYTINIHVVVSYCNHFSCSSTSNYHHSFYEFLLWFGLVSMINISPSVMITVVLVVFVAVTLTSSSCYMNYLLWLVLDFAIVWFG